MEPVTIISLIMTFILVGERIIKYCVKNTKKSKCCGASVEFEYHGEGSSGNLNA
jgi:hypothetical protein